MAPSRRRLRLRLSAPVGVLTAPTRIERAVGKGQRTEMSFLIEPVMETIITFAAVVECIGAGILLYRLLR